MDEGSEGAKVNRNEEGHRSALGKEGAKKKKKETGAWSSIWGRNEWALVGQGWAWKCLENLLGRVLGHGHCQDELGEVRGEKSKRMF